MAWALAGRIDGKGLRSFFVATHGEWLPARGRDRAPHWVASVRYLQSIKVEPADN